MLCEERMTKHWTACLDINRALGHFGRGAMTMIGRQSLEINHTRQPYNQLPTRIHLKQEIPSYSGRASSDVSFTLNNKITSAGKLPSRPRPTNLLSPKHRPDIRFSLETRPFQRETTVYKPRKPGHVPLSAASHIRKGTFGLLGTN